MKGRARDGCNYVYIILASNDYVVNKDVSNREAGSRIIYSLSWPNNKAFKYFIKTPELYDTKFCESISYHIVRVLC